MKGERVVWRSSNGGAGRYTGLGDGRRELCSEFMPEDRSIDGDGDRGRLQVRDVGPFAIRSFRRGGLLDLGRQPPPLGPVGGDLLGRGDRARNGSRLRSYGDLDLRL